jgi:hypothetical protein
MGLNFAHHERPYSILPWRLFAAAGLLVAFSFSPAAASIIVAVESDLVDIDRVLAESESTANASGSASSPLDSQKPLPIDDDDDSLEFARNLSHSSGNMAAPSSSSGGQATGAPTALSGAAFALAPDALHCRLAAEAPDFLPDPPVEWSLRPPQWRQRC